jgi:putative phosphoribosyl transferase
MRFENREKAGQALASKLKQLKIRHPLILALPRGGVPIAAQVAEELHAPLDILVVRKIGAPDNPEYAIGAIAEDGLYHLNDQAIDELQIPPKQLQTLLDRGMKEVEQRIAQLRGNRPLTPFNGKTVILIDDGLATGSTARVAVDFLRQNGAKQVIFAAPVCARDSAQGLRSEFDRVICLEEPDRFFAVGMWYEDFSQTSDQEVSRIMTRFYEQLPIQKEVLIQDHATALHGDLVIPAHCKGLVLFAHGSGSSRLSPRNQKVARFLNQHHIGTFLFDLLSPTESLDRRNVFDIPFLGDRLLLATQQVLGDPLVHELPIGYFGASTGGAAALWAAADQGSEISAVVSRGGRPDLAIPKLNDVTSPTLLIVGGDDEPVIEMNEAALNSLKHGELVIVPGATHLFEEPGTLEVVCNSAVEWFDRYFAETRNKRTKPHAA